MWINITVTNARMLNYLPLKKYRAKSIKSYIHTCISLHSIWQIFIVHFVLMRFKTVLLNSFICSNQAIVVCCCN